MANGLALKREGFGPRTHRASNLLLFGVTAAELVILAWLTPRFTAAQWVYLAQHVLVMAIAVTRAPPLRQDYSLRSSLAVLVAYSYPYAQAIWLALVPGVTTAGGTGLVLVSVAAALSLASLLCIGRYFGVRPALRGLATSGPYAIVRHPMYLSYVVADIGYNLAEGNAGTLLLMLIGWASLLYRIGAEERVLSGDALWKPTPRMCATACFPGLW